MKDDRNLLSEIELDAIEEELFMSDAYERCYVFVALILCLVLLLMTLILMCYNFTFISEYISCVFHKTAIHPAMAFLFGVYIYAFITRLSWFRMKIKTIYDVLIMQCTSFTSMLILFLALRFIA